MTASEALAAADPLIVNGDWARAEALLIPAVEKHPAEQALRLSLARVYSGQKAWAKAYAQYESALSIGPENAPLHAEAGTIANAATLTDKSIEHYARAKSLDARNHVHPLYLAMVQIKRGTPADLAAAKANLVVAATLKPDLAEAWGVLGELALRENALDLALQHLEKARALQPHSVKWRLAEAKAHKRQGRPQKGLDLLVNLPEPERSLDDVQRTIDECRGMLGLPGAGQR